MNWLLDMLTFLNSQSGDESKWEYLARDDMHPAGDHNGDMSWGFAYDLCYHDFFLQVCIVRAWYCVCLSFEHLEDSDRNSRDDTITPNAWSFRKKEK